MVGNRDVLILKGKVDERIRELVRKAYTGPMENVLRAAVVAGLLFALYYFFYGFDKVAEHWQEICEVCRSEERMAEKFTEVLPFCSPSTCREEYLLFKDSMKEDCRQVEELLQRLGERECRAFGELSPFEPRAAELYGGFTSYTLQLLQIPFALAVVYLLAKRALRRDPYQLVDRAEVVLGDGRLKAVKIGKEVLSLPVRERLLILHPNVIVVKPIAPYLYLVSLRKTASGVKMTGGKYGIVLPVEEWEKLRAILEEERRKGRAEVVREGQTLYYLFLKGRAQP